MVSTILPLSTIFSNAPLNSSWEGDDLSDLPDEKSLRVMFHNVNGLTIQGPDGFDMFANEQGLLHVDIQGFSEHCLDTTKFHVQHRAQELIRQHYSNQFALHLNSSQEAAVNIYKPGGTGILALGDVASRLEPQGKGGDPMGRWSYLHLRRKDSPPITIISAYQVCPRPTNLLGNTAYHQQLRALQSAERYNLHPRQAFIQDLGEFLGHLQSRGHDIIVGGDFNESLEDRNSGIHRLVTTHNLTDPFLVRFPNHHTFGTHSMGHRRIDSVYVTPGLLPGLTRIGYSPFQYSKPSDHRPVLLEFDKTIFFGQR